jgi:hypothetical protein
MPAIRGSHAGGSPFQHPPTEVVFEQLYLAGDRRLGYVQTFGGAAEAAFLKDHQQQAKLFQHGWRVMRNSHHGNH